MTAMNGDLGNFLLTAAWGISFLMAARAGRRAMRDA
jgi:hypothetical protein